MEQVEYRGKWIGEICVIFLLEWIMILFKLVEPIHWPAQFPGKYVGFANEFIYLIIEFILVIVIIAHFIFQIPFKELGLKAFKESIGGVILNLFYLSVCIGAAYVMSQFSKSIEIDLEILIGQVITNFIAIAFIKELIFRGFWQRAFEGLMKGRKVTAGLVTAVLFSLTYLPNILVSLNEVSIQAIAQALVIPVVMGFYLGLLYAYSRNIWTCMSIHGVLISFGYLEQDFMIIGLESLYIISLLVYLLCKVFHYYRTPEEKEEEALDQADEVIATSEDQMIDQAERLMDNENTSEYATEHAQSEIQVKEGHAAENKCKDEAYQPGNESSLTKKSMIFSEEKAKKIDIPSFTTSTPSPSQQIEKEIQRKLEEQEKPIPNLFEVLSPTVDEEEDLSKGAANLNTKVELEKVVHLGTKKVDAVQPSEKVQLESHEPAIEDTIVMPKVTKTQLLEVEMREKKRQKEAFIKAEPNFIAHLESYLGEFEAVYKQMIQSKAPSQIPIDILYFKGNKANALVTNGMRGLPMNVPPELKDYQNIELMVFVDKSFDFSDEGILKEENAWIIKLLSDLATYPYLTNSYLGWGQIVGNGEALEPYDDTTEYCGALVYPAIDEASMKFCNYIENDVNVFIYNVMPLYKEELGFIQAQSSEQFINLMAAMGISQCIKKNRSNVIREMNR